MSSNDKLSRGDAALLQFALWAELVESDLWTQYAELGGVGPSGGGAAQASEEFQGFIGGNPAYTLALQNLDGDMPQYITDNTDDELSHAAFLTGFLEVQRRSTSRPGAISKAAEQSGDWGTANQADYQPHEP